MKKNITSFLSFDVEALPGRAADNLLERLVWGNTKDGQFGISRIVDILDEYGIKGCFMIDMAICALYGDAAAKEIVDFLVGRGHEIHVHLHSEWIIRKWGIATNTTEAVGMSKLDASLSVSLMKYAAWKFWDLTGCAPLVFRSGAFLFNEYTIEAARSAGFSALSNYNSTRHSETWVDSTRLTNSVFSWPNGILELPVDFSPEPLSLEWEKYIGWFDRVTRKSEPRTFNLVMHSWSLLKRVSEHMTEFEPQYEEKLRKICMHLKENTTINTYSQFLKENVGKFDMQENLKCNSEPVLVVGNIFSCNICGFSTSKALADDVCPGCKSRARHRQVNDVFRRVGNPFDGKKVLANFASALEKKLFLNNATLTNFDVRPVPDIDFQMDVQDMKIVEDESFDAFLSIHVLNHVRNDFLALQEINRVLKLGGVACVTVPYRENESTVPFEDLTLHYGTDALEKFGVGSYRRYGHKDVIDLFGHFFDVKFFRGFDTLTNQNMDVFFLEKKGQMSFEEIEKQLHPVRSLDYWPSKKVKWNSIEDFLDSDVIESGIHSIALSSQILDVYVEIVPEAPAYVYFHGNCPRADDFKLPVFSGSNVTEGLRVTKIVPSDPTLLMDQHLELSWHAGSKGIPLQEIYKKVFQKIFSFSNPGNIVFWGGSGGGFAALFYSHLFPASIALVWNPQTIISNYLSGPVSFYKKTAFNIGAQEDLTLPDDIISNVVQLYKGGYSNKVIYLQNDEDWHVGAHLVPFLEALGLNSRDLVPGTVDGIVAKDVYLYLGRFSKDHAPPSNIEIHCALQQVFAMGGVVDGFNFGTLLRAKHLGKSLPKWVVDAVSTRAISFFRPDWPHHTQDPVLNLEKPNAIKFSTGAVIESDRDGCVDWSFDFHSNITTNVHELHSLMHVGRLLALYEENRNSDILSVAIGIVKSFLAYVSDETRLQSVMTNRGYSSADHSMSIRANVLVKLLQVLRSAEEVWVKDDSLLRGAIAHLWTIGDVVTDPAYLYPSNYGIMVSLTGLQIANQFRSLKYISDQYIRASTRNLITLIRQSFDGDGWANENTVGYHSFILRLLRDYAEYSRKNSLGDSDLVIVEDYIRRGSQALTYCVRQDGSIPPIGDSPLYKAGLPSTNHSKFFKESGFLIIKDEKTYASLVCGSRSANHKQVDDASITLSYDCEDILVDGGSYCYDSQDPYRKYLESFRGHSGVYAEQFSADSPRQYLANRIEAGIGCYLETRLGRFSKARYRLKSDGVECERRLFVGWNGEMFIMDNISSSRADSAFVQSFLLGPQMKHLTGSDNRLIFEGDRYGVAIVHHSPSEMDCIAGMTDPQVQGWCSVNWRERLSTNQLSFRQAGVAAIFMTTVHVFRKGTAVNAFDSLGLPSDEVLSTLRSI